MIITILRSILQRGVDSSKSSNTFQKKAAKIVQQKTLSYCCSLCTQNANLTTIPDNACSSCTSLHYLYFEACLHQSGAVLLLIHLYGFLDVLKWLRAQDPPCAWNANVCSNAAENGHLDVLQWARTQNLPASWLQHFLDS
jgi:hypothetical protein